jgi:hypothetical protein
MRALPGHSRRPHSEVLELTTVSEVSAKSLLPCWPMKDLDSKNIPLQRFQAAGFSKKLGQSYRPGQYQCHWTITALRAGIANSRSLGRRQNCTPSSS